MMAASKTASNKERLGCGETLLARRGSNEMLECGETLLADAGVCGERLSCGGALLALCLFAIDDCDNSGALVEERVASRSGSGNANPIVLQSVVLHPNSSAPNPCPKVCTAV